MSKALYLHIHKKNSKYCEIHTFQAYQTYEMMLSVGLPETAVVLTLQPILKLPPPWNVKYPELSSPILQVVPSILSLDNTGDMTIRPHDRSTP